jgi:hypothetical protein
MSVELNHTIVHARDNRESAEFLAGILGLQAGTEWGPFIPVATSNGVTLDFATIPAESITMQHYAFLVSDDEFDAAFERIRQAEITYYADPHLNAPEAAGRDQPPPRRARAVLPGSGRPRYGDHHPPLQQPPGDAVRSTPIIATAAGKPTQPASAANAPAFAGRKASGGEDHPSTAAAQAARC